MLSLVDTLQRLLRVYFRVYSTAIVPRAPVTTDRYVHEHVRRGIAVHVTDRGFAPLRISRSIIWFPRIIVSLPQMMCRSCHARM
jgi:hypothetical protein